MAIELRDWQETDCTALAQIADDPQIAEQLRDTFPSPYTEEDALFFINLARRTTEDRGWLYAITKDGAVIGGISLTFGQDVYQRSAELGYWVGRAEWGGGNPDHQSRLDPGAGKKPLHPRRILLSARLQKWPFAG